MLKRVSFQVTGAITLLTSFNVSTGQFSRRTEVNTNEFTLKSKDCGFQSNALVLIPFCSWTPHTKQTVLVLWKICIQRRDNYSQNGKSCHFAQFWRFRRLPRPDWFARPGKNDMIKSSTDIHDRYFLPDLPNWLSFHHPLSWCLHRRLRSTQLLSLCFPFFQHRIHPWKWFQWNRTFLCAKGRLLITLRSWNGCRLKRASHTCKKRYYKKYGIILWSS